LNDHTFRSTQHNESSIMTIKIQFIAIESTYADESGEHVHLSVSGPKDAVTEGLF
jgi:hypothetical protein